MKALTKFLNRNTKEVSWNENTYTPKQLKVEKTVYPNGEKQMSLNGKEEWYGLQEGTLKK